MKRLIPTLLLVAVFIAACLWWEGHVRNHAQDLIRIVDSASESVRAGEDYATCENRLNEFYAKWDHMRSDWELLIAHKRLADIEIVLVQARSAAENQDKEQTLSCLDVLKLELAQLIAYYSIGWSNLL